MSARTPGAAASVQAPLAPQAAADELTRLYRLARALCGSADLAEDLVQETYARVLARPRLLRGGDTFSYMARALRNTYYNHRRSARARPEQALADGELELAARNGSRGDPHAALVAAELYRAIATLPADQRVVIAVVDIAGLSYNEAARVLRVPPGTVMSRLYRGRARLAAALG
ncbi:MAG: RNA polymerase sigma factor [Solirubrobacteraceae bacterium]|nr:RNA polymerase sigma factor [Solirubrobacteraceae bacterium]